MRMFSASPTTFVFATHNFYIISSYQVHHFQHAILAPRAAWPRSVILYIQYLPSLLSDSWQGRQDRQNWHLNLTFQDTCVTCRAAFTILAMFLCYLYNIFNCIVEHEDNDQLEDHNGEFTEKKCVRGRLDWITLLPLQDSTKGTSTKSLKIQI